MQKEPSKTSIDYDDNSSYQLNSSENARCSKAVSIPAPVHYAHLAAYASRTFDFDDNHDQECEDDFVENAESVSIDDIKTKLMVLDPKIENEM
ncbi:unnamed protein product, partial [Rotaria sordida]